VALSLHFDKLQMASDKSCPVLTDSVARCGGGRRGDDRPALGICVWIMAAMISLRKR
jgi:hypothetical protein